MADVDMKDASASAAGGGTGTKESSEKATPVKIIRMADIVRNVELIVKAVESNQTRLTTKAISRLAMT